MTRAALDGRTAVVRALHDARIELRVAQGDVGRLEKALAALDVPRPGQAAKPPRPSVPTPRQAAGRKAAPQKVKGVAERRMALAAAATKPNGITVMEGVAVVGGSRTGVQGALNALAKEGKLRKGRAADGSRATTYRAASVR